jgi:hypothetical protein
MWTHSHRFGEDTQAYSFAVGLAGYPSCEEAAAQMLKDVRERSASYVGQIEGIEGEELAFQV